MSYSTDFIDELLQILYDLSIDDIYVYMVDKTIELNSFTDKLECIKYYLYTLTPDLFKTNVNYTYSSKSKLDVLLHFYETVNITLKNGVKLNLIAYALESFDFNLNDEYYYVSNSKISVLELLTKYILDFYFGKDDFYNPSLHIISKYSICYMLL